MAPTVHKTTDQAAAQITRDGYAWKTGDGSPPVISYSFRATAPNYDDADSKEKESFVKVNDAQIAAVKEALGLWSDLANVTFKQVVAAHSVYTNNAVEVIGAYSSDDDGAAAFGLYPGNPDIGARSGDLWLNNNSPGETNPVQGEYAFQATIHEVGHTLGMEHPGNYNAAKGVTITYDKDAPYIEDSYQYTVMSYFEASNTGANYIYNGKTVYAVTPLLDDIAAIQRVYGANMNTRTGDTVYGFHSNADRNEFHLTSSTDQKVFAIWDAGGDDTLDFSGYGDDQLINLTAGTFSNVGALTSNVAIAEGVTIENAIGGSGNDTINGNDVGNELTGNGGRDVLSGGGGNDIMQGGAGRDTLDGGGGSDTVSYVEKGNAVVVTLNGANAVTAYVNGTAEDTLRNVENIQGGSGDDILNGDNFANTFVGNSGDDTLRGGGGRDRLDGGAGTDTADYSDKTTDVTVTLNGATYATVTVGGAAEDAIRNIENLIGGSGSDGLTGDGGDNVLTGNGGDDTLAGLAGNDTLVAGIGKDTIDGGAGIDTADYSSATGAVFLTLNGNSYMRVTVGGAAGGWIRGIENVIGSAGDDSIAGDGNVNQLSGGAGNDILMGGGGIDRLDGGAGSDTADFADQTQAVVATLNSQATVAVRIANKIDDTLVSIENIWGGSGNDTLTGDAYDNVLRGGLGNDILDGGSGGSDTADYSDRSQAVVATLSTGAVYATVKVGGQAEDNIRRIDNLIGGSGNDTLTGNAGANHLDGGAGDDLIAGGAGKDTLIGGAGAHDTLDYTYVTSSTTPLYIVLTDNQTTTVFAGTVAEDSISGFENVFGGAGNDFISGNSAANVLRGNAGDDTLMGGAGKDVLDGGAGVNTAAYADKTLGISVTLVDTSTAVTVKVGGVAEDTLTNIQNVIGGGGSDELTGNSSANTLDGGSGDDVLVGGAGFDTLIGGIGSDTADYSAEPKYVRVDMTTFNVNGYVQVELGRGSDDQMSGVENVTGGSAADTLTGDSNVNVFVGNGGGDTLNGGDGNDLLFGGAGYDTLKGGTGDDVLQPGADGASVDGGDGYSDSVDFSDQTAAITLRLAGASNATFKYGSTAEGSVRNVEDIIGGSGNDRLTGDSDANSLAGNYLVGGAGDDGLYGMGGNDHLMGGAGKDVLDGGANDVYGGDTADYSDKTVAISVTLTDATSTYQDVLVGGVAEDKVINIENIIGGSGNDIIADGAANPVNNSFEGGAGNDTLLGGAGDDFLTGGAGRDTIDGGAGQGDYANFDDTTADIVLTLNGSTYAYDTIGGVTTDRIKNVENVIGGSGNDTFKGDAGSNSFDGGEGNDTLIVSGGFDYLNGGNGIDTVDFSSETADLKVKLDGYNYALVTADDGSGATPIAYILNDETFIAGSGNDTLDGGTGFTTLRGNGGNDHFVFSSTLNPAIDLTRIADFTHGADHIDLDHTVFGAWSGPASLNATNFAAGNFTTAQDADDRIIYDTKTGALYYDGDGVGGNPDIEFAVLANKAHLTASDFMIV